MQGLWKILSWKDGYEYLCHRIGTIFILMMRELLEAYKEKLEELISTYPRGSVISRKRGSRVYYYLKYWEDGRAKEKYIGKELPAELIEAIQERKRLEAELKKIKAGLRRIRRRKGLYKVWTIGYEKLNWEDFIKVLKDNGIDYVVDVRINNFSMRPEYRNGNLSKGLAKEGIGYVHMPEFGNPYKNTEWQELFAHRMSSLEDAFFQRLRSLLKKHSLALLCYERNPLDCHRSVIVYELAKRGFVDAWRDLREVFPEDELFLHCQNISCAKQ